MDFEQNGLGTWEGGGIKQEALFGPYSRIALKNHNIGKQIGCPALCEAFPPPSPRAKIDLDSRSVDLIKHQTSSSLDRSCLLQISLKSVLKR